MRTHCNTKKLLQVPSFACFKSTTVTITNLCSLQNPKEHQIHVKKKKENTCFWESSGPVNWQLERLPDTVLRKRRFMNEKLVSPMAFIALSSCSPADHTVWYFFCSIGPQHWCLTWDHFTFDVQPRTNRNVYFDKCTTSLDVSLNHHAVKDI